jgi:hypothetical protein
MAYHKPVLKLGRKVESDFTNPFICGPAGGKVKKMTETLPYRHAKVGCESWFWSFFFLFPVSCPVRHYWGVSNLDSFCLKSSSEKQGVQPWPLAGASRRATAQPNGAMWF